MQAQNKGINWRLDLDIGIEPIGPAQTRTHHFCFIGQVGNLGIGAPIRGVPEVAVEYSES